MQRKAWCEIVYATRPGRTTLLAACPEVNAPSQKVLRIPASRHQMADKQLPVFQHLFRSPELALLCGRLCSSRQWPGCPGIFLITDFPVMKRMIFISPCHMGHSSGSTSHIFLMHSCQVGDGMRRGSVPQNIKNLDCITPFQLQLLILLFLISLQTVTAHPI
jgi:hypothetical protein